MTMLLDLRALPTGGFVAPEVAIKDGASGRPIPIDQFQEATAGRHVVLVTHGFNVNSREGRESLMAWDALCALPGPHVFIGVLWPGDSRFLPVLDYPVEGAVAMQAGALLAHFIETTMPAVSMLSMASHSLGARTMLETIHHLQRRVDTLILMAAAIEDDCLSREYQAAAARVRQIHVLASTEDWVLRLAFPIGNPVGQIVMQGHPYFRRALGRKGPNTALGIPAPWVNWQLPKGWDYGHGDYMPGDDIAPRLPPPVAVPSPQAPEPGAADGWKPSWSAAVIATQFR